jgi:hypothetical protein
MTAYHYAYNGAEWGDETNLDVISVEGLDAPPVRTSDQDLPGADGTQPGMDRLGPRSVVFECEWFEADAATLFADAQVLARATARRDNELPLVFQLDESLPIMRMNGRFRRRNSQLTWLHGLGQAPVIMQFDCSDPLVYSDELQAAITVPATQSIGWEFPREYPRAYGTPATGGWLQATNEGSAPTSWIARVVGPCIGPSVLLGPNRVRWDGELAVGDTLVLDAHPARLLATVNGTSNRYVNIDDQTTWFSLAPGENEVRFQSDDNEGQLTFEWRHAWWSVT